MITFKPQLVIISAGFDAHYRDPLGGFNLTEEDFAELTRIVMQIADAYADGKIVSLLEGGYDLKGLALSALAHVKALQEQLG
jgi:acetoin utilization deacetylase AcuC-like enzyme